ncbi:hypothetical protein ACFWA9_04645 [Kitasatospora sp. NPDC059973]|uniref:hypothetical protein n=1 Tax=Kitasatospora sp. NPDC059973 TaxID=3347020 RepID=UPI0036A55BEA
MSKPTLTWTIPRVEHTPDPLAQLTDLGRWLDDPARRLTWRAAHKDRQAAATDADRAYTDAQRASQRFPAARIVDLREQQDLAHGRAGLLALVEALAETSRLRVTTTVLRGGAGPDAAEPRALGVLATRIDFGTRELLAELAGTDFVYPDEVHRAAEAALRPLTNRWLAAEVTGEPAVLRVWAEALEFALAVVQTASTRA